MAQKIILKNSSVASRVPNPGDLDLGEMAINTTDGKLFIKKGDGTVIEAGGGGSGGGQVDSIVGGTNVTVDAADPINPIVNVSQALFDAKENTLGNPPSDGDILTSTALGVRSWVSPPANQAGVIGIYPKVGVETLTDKRHQVNDKPVYTQTFYTLTLTTNFNITTNLTGIYDTSVVDFELYAGGSPPLTVTSAYTYRSSTISEFAVRCNTDGALLRVAIPDNNTSYVNKPLYITIEYTKTADTNTSPIAVNNGLVPIGGTFEHSSRIPPTGYLLADGSEVSETTYAELFAEIGTTQAPPFDLTSEGKAHQSQYNTNLTDPGTLTWTTSATGNLGTAISMASEIVTKDRVYIMGGLGGSTTTLIQTAPIDANGVIGTWTNSTATLPQANQQFEAVRIKDKLYVIGGYSGTAAKSGIQYTDINPDGTLSGTWTIHLESLPIGLRGHQCIVHKNFLYVLGGLDGGGIYRNEIYSFRILPDGTLAKRRTLPANASDGFGNGASAVIGNRLYMFAGQNTTNETAQVISAEIFASGLIGPWMRHFDLPVAMTLHNVAVTNKRVYIIGGQDINAVELTSVYSAPIYEDAMIGEFTLNSSLPSAIARATVIVTSSRIYNIAGQTGSNTLSNGMAEAVYTGGKNDYKADSWTPAVPTVGNFYLPNIKMINYANGHNQTYTMIRYK